MFESSVSSRRIPLVLCVLVVLIWSMAPSSSVEAAGAARGVNASEEGASAPDLLDGLSYRLIGPVAGGRVARVTGVAGDPLTYYAATASGGVWKSVDGGMEWESVFDDQTTSSTGSIAVAPSDPNVVYVGSGEANVRGNVSAGDGIYKSTDGGATWQHVWRQRGQIGTMIVHPENPDVAFAAVLGHAFGPNPERGVYRTTDGGATWERVLFRDADTGASDVTFDPENPRVLFAGLWQARRSPWGLTSGGPGSGLFVSRDGGDTWTELGTPGEGAGEPGKEAGAGRDASGLPAKPWGRVGVRVAPSAPDRVYALIEAAEGGLFRSDDGGATWKRVNPSRGLRQRAWYYSNLTVDPYDADTVWFPQVSMLRTIDAGEMVRTAAAGGWDYHDVWIDPEDPDRMIVGSDAGVSLSRDGGATWRRPPLPISQAYHVATDTRTPYRVMATLQDFGTASGPSNSLHDGGIYLSDWHGVGGGEAGHIVADPEDPDVVYAGEYLGVVTRHDDATGQSRNVSAYPWNGSGHGAEDLAYRFQWTAPIALSPHDHRVVYHAANVLFRSRDGGQHWQAISPDLTRNDKAKQRWSGGPITGDNTGVEFYDTIFAVAESPVQAGVIWAGSDDGLVHVTRDDGASWTDVTGNIPGLPEWGTVTTIEPSSREAGTAWVVVDAHRLDDPRPYLWRTDDFGAHWQRQATDLPDPLPASAPGTAGKERPAPAEDGPLFVVREDPAADGVLYLGGEHGVYLSWDGGTTWRSLRLDLPTVPVTDLAVHGDDLVVGTKGRSLWILDDLGPLRALASPSARAAVAGEPIHLYTPRPAVRWRYRSVLGDSAGAGDNPPPGALITYWLRQAPEEGTQVTLDVLDAAGRVVRTLRSTPEPQPIGPDHPDWPPDHEVEPALSTDAGMNRASWDLAWDGAGFIDGAMIDWGDPTSGPLAVPGTYTLRLTVGDTVATAPLTITPDPRVDVAPEDLAAQLDFALGLRADLRRVIADVARIGEVRDQIAQRNALLRGRPDAPPELIQAGEGILDRLDTLEHALYSPDAEVTYDILAGRHGGAKLYSQLAPLFSFVNNADGAPTQGMREVAAELHQRLGAREDELDTLLTQDVAALNAQAAGAGISYVLVPQAGQ